jgi:hypothetical protein
MPVPMLFPFTRNVTVPFGCGTAVDWTVAVKVTDCPYPAGLSEETTVVVVASGTIASVVGEDVPPL